MREIFRYALYSNLFVFVLFSLNFSVWISLYYLVLCDCFLGRFPFSIARVHLCFSLFE